MVSDLRSRIEALPRMDTILPALAGLPPAYLVGGAVRDLLRGARTVDLDVAIEGDARATAEELAARIGGAAQSRERFGTATVRSGELSLDLATTRRERYRSPGALPEVEPAPLEQDLGRRDFTVNAMAASLAAEERGRLHDPHAGRADVEAGVIRVLHRHSFVDDPTRILRAVRYEARLGFAMEGNTHALARAAAADRVFDSVSGKRIGTELMRLFDEDAPREALGRVVDLGLGRALDPALRIDPDLAEEAARGAEATGAERGLAALAALVVRDVDALAGWIERLDLGASARDRVLRAARSAPSLADALRAEADLPASELDRLLGPEPREALALALALGAPREPVTLYLETVRGVQLDIGGDDLVAAGVAPSPALGRALDETLRRKLDGQVAGREEELRLALSLAREEEGAG